MFRIFLVLLFAAATANTADNDADILKNVDIFQMEVVSDPQISPDGTKESGVLDYWHERGFPPQCRPIGSDDFECD